MAFYGLDIHKKFIQSAVIDAPADSPKRSFQIATEKNSIKSLARSLGPSDFVALESTTHAFPIASLLRENGAKVVVSNPMKTKIIAESKVKTDKVDALALANLLAAGFLPTVWEPDQKTSQLRKITSYSQAVNKQKTMTKNRIHSILHRNLIPYNNQFSDLFGVKGRAFLQSIALPEQERFQINQELALLDYLENTRVPIETRIARESHGDKDITRIMTIPGIDFMSAAALKAAIGNITRFNNPKKLVGYFGLNSRVSQSSETCYTGPITKRGRSHGRWVLIQAAQHAVKLPGPLRAFFLRLQKTKGRNKAIVAVAAKLARIIWHMLTKQEDYFYAPPLRTKEKLAKLRIIATGERKKSGPKKGEPSKGGRTAYLLARKNDHSQGNKAEGAYKKLVAERLKPKGKTRIAKTQNQNNSKGISKTCNTIRKK